MLCIRRELPRKTQRAAASTTNLERTNSFVSYVKDHLWGQSIDARNANNYLTCRASFDARSAWAPRVLERLAFMTLSGSTDAHPLRASESDRANLA
jgi:hypothetical protein